MPVQHLDQCSRLHRYSIGFPISWATYRLQGYGLAAHPCAGGNRAQQIAWGLGVDENLFRQGNTKSIFDTGDQFQARQAVQTQVGIQGLVQCDFLNWYLLGTKLSDQLLDQLDQDRWGGLPSFL